MEFLDIVKLIDKFNALEAYGRRDLIKQYIKDEFLSNGEMIDALIYIAKMPLTEQFYWHKFVKNYISTLVNFS